MSPCDLVELTLRLLARGTRGEEAFVLSGDAQEVLAAAIAEVTRKASAKRALEDLLKLARVLEQEKGSPAAAQAILDATARSEAALAIIGVVTGRAATTARAELARFSGRAERTSAPKYEARAPEGSVKLSSFLQPGRPMREPHTSTPEQAKKRAELRARLR